MIHFILLQNRQGKTRLAKWYACFEHEEKKQLEVDVHRLLSKRNPKFTNFVEFSKYKIIFRRYAGMYFSFAVDMNDNELAYLEIIHLFVELLDKYFESVRELDLVFNFPTLFTIVDEMFLAGEIQETSKAQIMKRLEEINKLD